MTRKNKIEEDYFKWMYDKVCEGRFDKKVTFKKLLSYLHNVDFIYKMSKDSNRAEDGIELRYRFAYETGCACADSYLEGPCSIFEMILALAIRCETFMDDARMGDRTSQWFWKMLNSMGLGSMTDSRFDIYYVDDVIETFLKRRYKPDGRGGLFTVKYNTDDMRRKDIWAQMCCYINEVYN